MALEREHKFRVEGSFPEVTQLQERYGALGYELHAQKTREQRDVYYDTPSLTLLHAGVALRQRSFAGQTLATYKGAGVVNSSLHTREELELPHTDPWPAAILAKLEPLGVVDKLAPLVELVTQRQRYLLVEAGQTRAELTFDEVTGIHGEQRVEFCELELEASLGTPDATLETLSLPLDQSGLIPHTQDKLTYALTLLGRL